jgi:hypothetical protein
MVIWATNPAQGVVGSAVWVVGLVLAAAVRFVSVKLAQPKSQEVNMMANVKSFAAGAVETIWAVGAGVLAA